MTNHANDAQNLNAASMTIDGAVTMVNDLRAVGLSNITPTATTTMGAIGNLAAYMAALAEGQPPLEAGMKVFTGVVIAAVALEAIPLIGGPVLIASGARYLLASFLGSTYANAYVDAVQDLFGNPPISPLILDLDGDGIELSSLEDSHAFFDLNNDGFAELTGWVGADDGILAFDANDDGFITNIDEVFGSETTDGFIELDAFDSNNDNLITSADANYSQLILWQDADGDGVSMPDEMQSLAAAGITSIDLNKTNVNLMLQGHHISSQSTFVMNGNTRDIKDVWFEHSNAITQELLPDTFVYDDAVWSLPNLKGYGTLSDLWVSITNDATLKTLVQDMVAQSFTNFSFSSFRADVNDILLRWLGTDGVNPTSRGPHVDARELEALEKLMNAEFSQANPTSNAGKELSLRWDDFVTDEAVKLLVQIPILSGYTAFKAAIDELMDIEENGPGLDSYTPEQLWNEISNHFDAAAAIIAAHPLKDFSDITYTTISDHLDGDISDLVAKFTAAQPSAAAAKENYWLDKLSILTSVAHNHDLTGAEFDTAVNGSYVSAFGLAGNQWLSDGVYTGTSANDTLLGVNYDGFSTLGKETLIGGLGNDTLMGGTKDDTYILRAGDGVDVINDYLGYVSPSADKVVFKNVASTAVTVLRSGVDDADLVLQYGGGNQVTVKDHFHEFTSWEIENFQFTNTSWNLTDIRNKVLVATNGNDYLAGFRTSDTLNGGAGNDTIKGYEGDDSLIGGVGNDVLIAGKGTDTLMGGNGNDTLTGYNTNQSMDGGSGDDYLFGDFGNDTLLGGAGNDTLDGGYYTDTLDGGAGNDLIIGDLADVYIGGTNTDTMQIAPPNSLYNITLNLATQTASYVYTYNNTTGSMAPFSGMESVIISSTGGNDSITGSSVANTINAGGGADWIDGGKGADLLIGEAGDDTLVGSRLDVDTLDGGAGFDLVSYQSETGQGLAINLAAGSMTQGANTELLFNLEALIGGAKNDTITGGSAAENLNGFKGNDVISAGEGADTLQGGEGRDTLTGGANNDVFAYTARSHSAGATQDMITDFVHAADLIDLSGLGFTAIQSGAATGTILGFSLVGGNTIIQSATADFSILLTGNVALSGVDFDFV